MKYWKIGNVYKGTKVCTSTNIDDLDTLIRALQELIKEYPNLDMEEKELTELITLQIFIKEKE